MRNPWPPFCNAPLHLPQNILAGTGDRGLRGAGRENVACSCRLPPERTQDEVIAMLGSIATFSPFTSCHQTHTRTHTHSPPVRLMHTPSPSPPLRLTHMHTPSPLNHTGLLGQHTNTIESSRQLPEDRQYRRRLHYSSPPRHTCPRN